MFDLIIKIGLFLMVLPVLLYTAMMVLGGLSALLGFVADRVTSAGRAMSNSKPMQEARRAAKDRERDRQLLAAANAMIAKEQRVRMIIAKRFIQIGFPPALRARGFDPDDFEVVLDYDFMRAGVRDQRSGKTLDVAIEHPEVPQEIFREVVQHSATERDLLIAADDHFDELGGYESEVDECRDRVWDVVDELPREGVRKAALITA